MILDKLIEKKDIYTYIRARIAVLNLMLRKKMVELPPKDREFERQRIIGRIKELRTLRRMVLKNLNREYTLEHWHCVREAPKGRKGRLDEEE
jgi:hypothetical protein